MHTVDFPIMCFTYSNNSEVEIFRLPPDLVFLQFMHYQPKYLFIYDFTRNEQLIRELFERTYKLCVALESIT